MLSDDAFTVSENVRYSSPSFKSNENSSSRGFVISGSTRSALNGSSIVIGFTELLFISTIVKSLIEM